MGGQPLAPRPSIFRDPLEGHSPVDFGPHQARVTVQATLGFRPRRKALHLVRMPLASQYYQLLSGHAETGSFLHKRMRDFSTGSRTSAGGIVVANGSRGTTFSWSARPGPQIRRLWRQVAKDCRWEHPKAPAVRKLWNEGAAEAVLEFLGNVRVRGRWQGQGVHLGGQWTWARCREEGEITQGRPRPVASEVCQSVSDGSATLGMRVGPEWRVGGGSHGLGMEDQEWKPRHGNEGVHHPAVKTAKSRQGKEMIQEQKKFCLEHVPPL